MKSIRVSIYIALSCIVLLEVGLRTLSLIPLDSATFSNDRDIGIRLRPSPLTNSFGFNDIDHPSEKEKGATRLAIIGDSFVFGVVPRLSNFSSIIQDFSKESGKRIEVFNMGIPSAGPRNYLGLLQTDAARMKIDIVCVILFIGNDITQSHPDFTTQVFMGSAHEVLQKPYLLGPSREYSYAYRFFRTIGRYTSDRIAKLFGANDGTFSTPTFLSIQYQRSEIYKTHQPRFIRESYAGILTVFEKMAEQAHNQHMKLVMVIAPDEIQVDPKLQSGLIEKYGMKINDYNFQQPQAILVERLNAMGISTLDLLASFRNANANGSLYVANDTHWNEKGNLLAAQQIWSFLADTGLLTAKNP